ncbi:DUF2490 domain-containing protein [Hymenobacter taeanensis]|uniref:DUF2490 domain-containing protein n=1 Tax=Hymenobacter taeanensis TaxID=2735321 RepID=A0A6M6BHS5_9BACT|nr:MULTISPECIES: DUF2490 domain-containing protein [Hymenobacter]QJX46595.1 DUF2490 domain-containing protein [Hymenobacter taeanensis]UOQ80455.1 DUF2490 domain-containing protein [Hymenobacter sp. 5414T-23]
MLPARLRTSLYLLAAVGGSSTQLAQAQTNATYDPRWGSWFIATVQLPPGQKGWGAFAEVQGRANAVARQFFYYELKSGVTYNLSKSFTLMVAGGRYSTSDYRDLDDGPLNRENRLWEQLTLTQNLARLKLEHRYRVEQRWFSFRDDIKPAGSFTYRNRIRYRFNAFLPLNQTTITDKTVFLSVYDEVFLNPRGPAFERNRVYAGVGYQFDSHWTLQAGWVNQANYTSANFRNNVYTPQTTLDKNNLVLALMYRIKRTKSAVVPTPERLPSQQD